MPSKSVKKMTPSAEPVVETPVVETPVVETPVVVESQELASPVKQKGGKKNAKTATPVVETTPAHVVETTPAPVLETTPAPVVETTPAHVVKKGGRAKKVEAQVSPPAVAVVEADVVPKNNKKANKASKVAEKPVAGEEQTGGKQKAAKKALVKKSKTPTPAVENSAATEQTETPETSERLVRSFKVKLPLKEEFEGRFTGLTPYQAANKALSKYFRETENPKQEITFLICESTRKSKKSVYTYVGKRYQLEVPVKYTIQDGREIVKNFKNSLKKVKKVDLANEQAAGAVATVVTPASSTA